MARGSSTSSASAGSSGSSVPMPGESGQLDARGRAVIRKKFFVTSESQLGSPPALSGYRPVGITYNKLLDNAYEQTVEYASLVPPGGSGVVETIGGLSGTFEMFTSYESRPIELHPKIEKLTADFGGYFTPDGFAKWPPLYSPDGGGGLGAAAQVRNPMFGVTRYKDVTMTFRHTYYTRTVGAGIYNGAGKVVTSLPAGFPSPRGPADSQGKEIKPRWLMQMPAISRDGESYRVVQEYVLLDGSSISDGLYEVTTTPGQG